MLSLPTSFIQSISHCNGFDEITFIEAHQQTTPISIRLNPFKKGNLNFNLNNAVLWNNNGYYLNERPNFTHDLLFQAGCYYVQEAGSMFIEYALKSYVNFDNTLTALDVCAAPGGKSTLLNSLLNSDSLLVANEVVKQRADVLTQNISKWGTCNTIVTNNDPSVFSTSGNYFDIILVDAPCSGSGLFRKQHDAIDEWSLDNVNLCCQRQKRILSDTVGCLKSDGTLVYSTCSYSFEENEAIVDWLIGEFNLISIQVPIQTNWGIVETQSDKHNGFGYRFYPDKTKTEGFFCAILKKAEDFGDNKPQKKSKNKNFSSISFKEQQFFANWIKPQPQHTIITFKDDFLLTNVSALNFANNNSHLYYRKIGTTIGSVVKQSLIPHHDLALSIYVNYTVQSIDCDSEIGMKFLKKELNHIHGKAGWNLMAYQNFGLGWIKHIGNRINNYLPNEFRILR